MADDEEEAASDERVSLYPLEFEEAMKLLLNLPRQIQTEDDDAEDESA